jgi:carboxyl-terminal processing protease
MHSLRTIAAALCASVGCVALVAVGASAHPLVSDAQSRTRPDTGSRVLDSTLALATFDSAWRTVGSSLSGRGVTSIDWPAVRAELRPRAAQASTDSSLRAVVDNMLRRLGESHFAILPPPPGPAGASGGRRADASLGTAGIVVRIVDRQTLIWRVDSAGSAWRAGVAPGWVVDKIDDFSVPPVQSADSSSVHRLAHVSGVIQALRGAPGTTVRLIARDAAGVRHDVSFHRDSLRGPVARFGNLPPLPASVELRRSSLPDGRCVGVIRYEYWMVPVMPALDRAVDAVRGCAGIVVDLRGNLGGVAGMMMGVAGHFLNEPHTLGIMRTRGEEMRFVANPRRSTDAGVQVEPYAGPLAILVDGMSASTSEMFAAGLQSLGRARVFGERTAGQALPAMATRLPTGDVLMHVVADFVAADGSRVEGRGVVPDESVPLVRADLIANRDAPLIAALRWIERARPRQN